MNVRYITASDVTQGELYFSHAVENSKGYGQLWFNGSWHLEFTKTQLHALAEQAEELARGL